MTRRLAVTFLLCAAGAALGDGLRQAEAASSSAEPHPAVVRVLTRDRDGASSLGSGVLVAVSGQHGLVVTNWHVVRDAVGAVTVVFPDGFRSGATVLRTDRDWDLAALAIWRPDAEPVPLSALAPQHGEPLTIAGYGPSGQYRAVTGRCTQYYPPSVDLPAELVELTAPARQGDSGGPIFNSRGELAGVLFGTASGRTMGSYCGRVRLFLGTITDEFRDVPSQETMIAQRPAAPEHRPLPSPLATIPAQPDSPGPPQRALADSGWSQPRGPSPNVSVPAANDPAAAAPELLGWKDIAGSTPGEQLKTILAAVGVLALLFQGLRLLASSEKS